MVHEKNIVIRAARNEDFESIVRLNRRLFPHDNQTEDDTRRWIASHWQDRVGERTRYYVVAIADTQGREGPIVGYALWSLKGGFARRATVELDQMGVSPDFQGKRLGTVLARNSLLAFESEVLSARGSRIGVILSSTGSGNQAALAVYRRALGLRVYAEMGRVYGDDAYATESGLINNDVEHFLATNPISFAAS